MTVRVGVHPSNPTLFITSHLPAPRASLGEVEWVRYRGGGSAVHRLGAGASRSAGPVRAPRREAPRGLRVPGPEFLAEQQRTADVLHRALIIARPVRVEEATLPDPVPVPGADRLPSDPS